MKKTLKKPSGFEKISSAVTKATGSSTAFVVAFSVIIIWILSGPVFNFSDTWQLVINTGTTIITFLMVFLIQRSQNKDSIALHLKLNELIVVQENASNRLVSVEEISESELKVLQKFYQYLAHLAEHDMTVAESHSLDIATALHATKLNATKKKLKSE